MKAIYKRVLCVLLALAIALPCAAISASAASDGHIGRTLIGREILMQMPNSKALVYAYDKLYECLTNYDEAANVTDGVNYLKLDEVGTVNQMLRSDCPEIFWYRGYSYSYSSKGIEKIYPGYTMTKNEAAERAASLAEAADKLCMGLDGYSDYEISLALHDRLAREVYYDFSDNDQTAYGALVDGYAVCAGYSAAYQYLLNKVGITAFTVTGNAKSTYSDTPQAHAWNLVLLDGEYYYTDTTWDDQTSGSSNHIFHAFFNVTSEKLFETHIPDNIYTDYLPLCSSTADNYFVRRDAVMSELDTEKLAVMLRRGGYTAAVCAPMGTKQLSESISANIREITGLLNISGRYSYSFLFLGDELVLKINSDSLPKGLLTLNVAFSDGAAHSCEVQVYLNDVLVTSVTSSSSDVIFEDLSYGEYTVIISAENCYTNIISVALDNVNDVDVKMRDVGDINGDGKINLKDSNLMKRAVLNNIGAEYLAYADIDNNGSVNTRDCYALKKLMLSAASSK